MEYQEFLASKRKRVQYTGFEVEDNEINPMLFKFQRAIVRWSILLGKASIFAECGMGKTPMQLEWARLINLHTGYRVLILAPLAVAGQTVREGQKFGVDVIYAKSGEESGDAPIVITNYERLHLFDVGDFGAVVLDESSILKNYSGKVKRHIVESFSNTPYKLACTATPAPNDHLELGNHAEFLNIMPSNEMIARWFINDSNKAGNYRLKGHAEDDFWRWLTSWAVCISKPSDLGDEYDMPGFELPSLEIHNHVLSASQQSIERAWQEGKLLPDTAVSSTNIHRVKRDSLEDRVAQVRELVDAIDDHESVVIWCDTNYEADALLREFPDALEVRGSHKIDVKEERLTAFTLGENRMIITKPDIAGFGLNWQHCHEMIYAGVGFSFEKLYQSLKRAHRYGQERIVNAHLIYAETEGNVKTTLNEKQAAFEQMQQKMNEAMHKYGLFRDNKREGLVMVDRKDEHGKNWRMILGDCVDVVENEIEDDSIDFSVYSPPFANLYIYSDAEADMGNSSDTEEFMEQYAFLVEDLYRVTRPGRLTAVHVKDLPLYKNSAGWFGIEDFSGMVSEIHRRFGWVFHSRVTIWKDPVHEMQKTNSHGLLHKNFAQRAQVCRTGLPDYLMVFVKPDEKGEGIDVKQLRHEGDYIGTLPPVPAEYAPDARRAPDWYPGTSVEYNYSIHVWQRYASPVWFDIDQTKVLNVKQARGDKDSKHICPLQLDVIGRAVDLWTNRGDLVLSPFAGIGSEGYSSIELGRKFIGVELKEEYFNVAVENLRDKEKEMSQVTLFDWAANQAVAAK